MISYFGNCNSPWECLILFEAVKEGLLPTVANRLTEDERKNIASGSVFIWDERRSSIKRWTDGITWSNSRVIGDFLEYRELLPDAKDDERPSRFTVKAYGLCKRTLCLATSDDSDEPKLRLVSYCAKRDAASGALPLPSKDPQFSDIVKRLEGIYGAQSASRQNRLSGVFKRNPSPTRDRRKSRHRQHADQRNSFSFNAFAAPVDCGSGSEPGQTWPKANDNEPKQKQLGAPVAPALPQHSEQAPHTRQSIPNMLSQPEHSERRLSGMDAMRRDSDDLPLRQSSNAGPDLIGRMMHEASQFQRRNSSSIYEIPMPSSTQGTGRDQILANFLRSQLDSVCEAERNPPSLCILPQPQRRNRSPRRNSEDVRLLDKLDNCVNAFY